MIQGAELVVLSETSWGLTLLVNDQAGQPVNLTGEVAELQVSGEDSIAGVCGDGQITWSLDGSEFAPGSYEARIVILLDAEDVPASTLLIRVVEYQPEGTWPQGDLTAEIDRVGDVRWAFTLSPSGGAAYEGDSGSVPAIPAIANGSITTSKLADNAVTTSKLADDAVTLAKLADLVTQTVIGRISAGTGNPEAITFAQLGTALGISPANVQLFIGPGIYTNGWTKPTSGCPAGLCAVFMVGGGGGGGSGRRGAAGNVRSGGSGGGSGQHHFAIMPLSALNATETVVVGAGGAGGAAVTADNTNGNVGVQGGLSSFISSNTCFAHPGARGNGGTNTAATGGLSGAGDRSGASSNGTGQAGTLPTAGSFDSAGSGGSGGGITSGNVANIGGGGGQSNNARLSPAGGALGQPGTVGVDAPTTTYSRLGGGGAGGGAQIGAAAGRGGNGGLYGGGGGGGGASENGFDSGAGGDGAAGFVAVICW